MLKQILRILGRIISVSFLGIFLLLLLGAISTSSWFSAICFTLATILLTTRSGIPILRKIGFKIRSIQLIPALLILFVVGAVSLQTSSPSVSKEKPIQPIPNTPESAEVKGVSESKVEPQNSQNTQQPTEVNQTQNADTNTETNAEPSNSTNKEPETSTSKVDSETKPTPQKAQTKSPTKSQAPVPKTEVVDNSQISKPEISTPAVPEQSTQISNQKNYQEPVAAPEPVTTTTNTAKSITSNPESSYSNSLDTDQNGKITCADFIYQVIDKNILAQYPNLDDDSDGIGCENKKKNRSL